MLVSATGSSVVPYGGAIDLADVAPARNASYHPTTGIALATSFATYAQMYRAQPWVWVLVNKLANSQSRLPVKVFERVSDDERRSGRLTPYGELLANPNPRLGSKGLWLWVRATRELYGEAMLLKLRDDRRRVRELHPIHPANVVVRPEVRDGEPTGQLEYAYLAGSQGSPAVLAFPASEVIHFKGYNPSNTARGLSACEPLRQTLLNEDAMRRASAAMWRNGARPSVALSTSRTLSEGAIERLSAQWDNAHRGVDNWSKTAILEEGLEPKLIQITPEDMQYIAGRQLNREECCAVWDVPPPAVHILDRATFSNITEQMRSLYRETMAPRIESDEDTLATQLAPDFGAGDGSLYAEWQMDAVLRASAEVRVAANAQAIQTGQMTPAEARADENRPFIPGSDQLLVNAALVPLLGAEDDGSPAAAVQTPTDILTLVNAAAGLVRAGFAPGPALAAVGLDPIEHLGLLPVTVKEPVDDSAEPALKDISGRDGGKLARRLQAVDSLSDISESALLANLDDDGVPRALLRAAIRTGADIHQLRAWIAASTDRMALEAAT